MTFMISIPQFFFAESLDILIAAEHGDSQTLKIYLSNPTNWSVQNKHGQSLLHLATISGNLEIVQGLCQRLGVNFINVLHTAFTSAEPKSIKETVKLSIFLRFRELRA
jgi:ankyrin repeat protein